MTRNFGETADLRPQGAPTRSSGVSAAFRMRGVVEKTTHELVEMRAQLPGKCHAQKEAALQRLKSPAAQFTSFMSPQQVEARCVAEAEAIDAELKRRSAELLTESEPVLDKAAMQFRSLPLWGQGALLFVAGALTYSIFTRR
jgi:hypothetical protein